MPKWEEIQGEWESSAVTFKELAEKHGVKDSTIRSRKNREKWQRNDATQRATKKSSFATESGSKGSSAEKNASSIRKQKVQKRRSGNPSPPNQFSKRNSVAVTHGLFAKFMPAETLEIMDSLLDRHPADLIWDQIQIQYAAIIRAQQIMFVKDQDDMTKEVKKTETYSDDNADSEKQEWEIQFAWDKHATFLNAQSRAMGELRSLIKQFCEMAHDDDERRLKLELMQVGINRTKVEIEKLSGNNDDGPIEIMITRKGGR